VTSTGSLKILYHKNIGEIKLVKSLRSKRLSIRVKPFDGVIVHIPKDISYKQAEDFVLEKVDWIRNSLNKMETVENKLTIFDETKTFRTKMHLLEINKWDKETISVRVLNYKILVKYPENILVRDERVQKMIRRGIERALFIEANEILPHRVYHLANKLGFRYKSLAIKNGKSRWGSCSHDNRINLNLHLMRLPEVLMDYVIVHELCHTMQKNHGPKFWELMEKVMPKSKQLNKELKNYQTTVY
jgi:predicted metal-dependent hydrolase